MKSDTIKYNEAIERNFFSFKRRFHEDSPGMVKGIAERSLELVKTWIGVRKNDTSLDGEISTIIAEAKKKVEAGQKKAEKSEVKAEKLETISAKKPVKKDKKAAG
jgi:hypothetical protein